MARRKPARTGKPATPKRSAAGKKRAVVARPRRAAKKAVPAGARTRRPLPRIRKAAVTKRTTAKRVAKKGAPAKRKIVRLKALKRTPARPVAAKKVARRASQAKPRSKAVKPQTPIARKKAVVTQKAAVVPVAQSAPKEPLVRRPVRKSPAVERQRRSWDESVVPGPPSSLDLDRTASSARSGRRELLERHENHTETSPALTGGDVDADWESAYAVGDEAPGGDNPTPDQDLVDDIGLAVGLVYEDNEELEGETKVSERDKHRWELDPGSSDDFEDR